MAFYLGYAPLVVTEPRQRSGPIILTSPHSGRVYAADFLARSRLDAVSIRRSEDSFVDELFAGCVGLGIPMLAAQFPRAFCDVNREAWELDPVMFTDPLPPYVNTASPRVQAGLGTVPRVVGNGTPIYANKLKFAEAIHRVQSCWEPFHTTLQRMINETIADFGSCLVIDCHSMPSIPMRPEVKPDIVLGDGHGTSCFMACTTYLEQRLREQGFLVRRNDPYAGGYITRHYGRPRDAVQVVQIEIARSLYMNERTFTAGEQFPSVQRRLTAVLACLLEDSSAWMGATGQNAEAAE